MLVLAWGNGALCMGQAMGLSNGHVVVAPGTSMRLAGFSDWYMGPNAGVMNHGTIDFGTAARLHEQPGAPFTGTGTETADWHGALSGAPLEPGGLGLAIVPNGPCDGAIRRGHATSDSGNGPSIARWYQAELTGTATGFDASLYYDATESGTLVQSALGISQAPALAGPWDALSTSNSYPLTLLAASVPGTSTWLTAFESDIATGIAQHSDAGIPAVQPTLVDHSFRIAMPADATLQRVEVQSMDGRTVSSIAFSDAPATAVIAAESWPAGAYLVRINGRWTQRIVKP